MPVRENVCTIHQIYCPPGYTSCPIGGCKLLKSADVSSAYRPYVADAWSSGSSSPFGSSTSTDPFGSSTSTDPFGSSTPSDPFGSSTSTDPFGSSTSSDPFGGGSSTDPFGSGTSSDPFGSPPSDPSLPPEEIKNRPKPVRHNERMERESGLLHVEGVIHNYRHGYQRRMGFVKLWDMMTYHVRMSNVAHRFELATDDGRNVYSVICYGEIRMESGQLTENARAEIIGRMNRHGVIIAREVSANRIPVRFRQEDPDDPKHKAPGKMPAWLSNMLMFIVVIAAMVLAMYLFPAVRVFVGWWLFISLGIEIALSTFLKRLPFAHNIARNPGIVLVLGLILVIVIFNYDMIDKISNGALTDFFTIIVMLIGLCLILKGLL